MSPNKHNSDQYTILAATPGYKSSGKTADLEKVKDYRMIFAGSLDVVKDRVTQNSLDLVMVELDLPDLNLTDLVIRVRSVDPDIPIVALGSPNGNRIEEGMWKAGIDDAISAPFSNSELTHRIARSLRLRRLSKQCNELQQENRGLWELSMTDGLTRLTNRLRFNELVIIEFARVKRYGGELGCILADIDHFKIVNDTYGHMVGDKVLQQTADIIRENIRSIDTAARYGGEEFILLLPETGGESLTFVAEKFRNSFADYDFRDMDDPQEPGPQHLTISLGVSSYPNSMVHSPEELVETADKALYKAKQTGRNRVVQL